jgi:HEAT repeat protein
MAWFSVRGKAWLAVPVLFLAGAGALAWVERAALVRWYYLRGLAAAGEEDRPAWVERVAGLDGDAVPGLLGCLQRDDELACVNTEPVFALLAQRWGADDPRWPDLAERLTDAFPRLSAPGQGSVLRTLAGWLDKSRPVQPPPDVVRAAGRLLGQATRALNATVQAGALDLAVRLGERPEWKEQAAGRELVGACLHSSDVQVRVRAIALAVRPGMGLLEPVVALLGDPAAEVRREAMRAVGGLPEAVTTDHLLPWLHDPDPDVRLLCEATLAQRGIQGKDLQLARLITDSRPAMRLKVLDSLLNEDLEPGVWLRRLSVDPAPEVRVAAVRAAADNPRVDLSDRIDQIARSDPSPTVSQLARYYLSCQQRRKITNPGP